MKKRIIIQIIILMLLLILLPSVVFAVTQSAEVLPPAQTKPYSINLTAYPETIEENGVDHATITANVTDALGKGVNGIEVRFSTSLGSFVSTNTNATSAVTTNGIATATLRSSTSAGTAIVAGSATIDGTPVEDIVEVRFYKTDVAVEHDTGTLDIEQEYESSDPDVGTIESQIDVALDKNFTDVKLEMTMRERYEDLPVPDPDKLLNELAAYFGVDTSAIAHNTPTLVYAELSATSLTADNVTGMCLDITMNKEWYDTVAGGNPSNVTMFKFNDTGEMKYNLTMTEENVTVNETAGTVTFHAAFPGFSVFAIVYDASGAGETDGGEADEDEVDGGEGSLGGKSTGGGGGGGGGGFVPIPEEIALPEEITIPIPGTKIFSFSLLGLEVSIDLKNMTSDARVALKVMNKPAEIPDPPGTVYSYFELPANLETENIQSASMSFRVNKSWTVIDDISVATIKLCRYASANGWEELETSKIKEDEDYLYFSADETPALSLFAITGEKKGVGFAPPAPSAPVPVPVIGWFIIIVAIAASAIIVSVVYLALRRRKA